MREHTRIQKYMLNNQPACGRDLRQYITMHVIECQHLQTDLPYDLMNSCAAAPTCLSLWFSEHLCCSTRDILNIFIFVSVC